MRIFICAGEPSGDMHGANLVQGLQRLSAGVECVGFGGERMQAAGCRLLYPLCRLAIMWFARALAHTPTFLGLLSRADRFFRHQRPDAVVLIDYPGFNWWLARRAHFHGIPVFYFVPPQLWGWAGWRVRKMRRWVDHVLCALPFEEPWYQERDVCARYVGHPYFDELPRQRLDDAFVADQRRRPGAVIGLLPGSRTQELERNLLTLLRAAGHIHAVRPDTRFLVACFKKSHRDQVEAHLKGLALPVETCVGRTPEIIELAHSCVAVSGSVGLELLYRARPTVVVYRIGRIDMQVCRCLKTSRYISLVNLLAEKELFPEFLTERCEAEAVGGHILRWLGDTAAYEGLRGELAALRTRVAHPGACERAAQYILSTVRSRLPANREGLAATA
ncbi:MAG TPA: lipid-A-disaccharide synthase [Gemmataceae bacterium]|jgi:lipid-A-disaccharide synthase|nr:lipid-A-disaccharide synthase [Gemmataceae bacterium]